MSYLRKIIIFFILVGFLITYIPCYAIVDKIEGLEHIISKINNFPLDKKILKDYDLYELYIENRSSKTYSIPGYSINFGVDYFNVAELSAQLRSSLAKRLALFHLAAGAVFIPFGAIAGRAAHTAVNSVATFKKGKLKVSDNPHLLSPQKTYIIYPDEQLSLYFLVSKQAGSIPNTLKFICRDEEIDTNYVVINNNVEIRGISLKVEGKIRKRYEDSEFPLTRPKEPIEEDDDFITGTDHAELK